MTYGYIHKFKIRFLWWYLFSSVTFPNFCNTEDILIDMFVMRLAQYCHHWVIESSLLDYPAQRDFLWKLAATLHGQWWAPRPYMLSVSLLQDVLFPLFYFVRNRLEILMTYILNWMLFSFAPIAMLFNLVKVMSMCACKYGGVYIHMYIL